MLCPCTCILKLRASCVTYIALYMHMNVCMYGVCVVCVYNMCVVPVYMCIHVYGSPGLSSSSPRVIYAPYCQQVAPEHRVLGSGDKMCSVHQAFSLPLLQGSFHWSGLFSQGFGSEGYGPWKTILTCRTGLRVVGLDFGRGAELLWCSWICARLSAASDVVS